MKALFFDTETGGLYPNQHSLLSLAVVAFEVHQGQAWELDSLALNLVPHPATSVGVRALEVQGIGWGSLEHCSRIEEPEAMARFAKWLEGYENLPVFAHNAPFDREFVSAAIRRSGCREEHLEALVGRHARWICTIGVAHWLVATGRIDPSPKGYSLDALCAHLGVKGRSRAGHEALEDARIGANLVAALMMRGEGDGCESCQ